MKADEKTVESIKKGNWNKLSSVFKELRGIPLTSFDEYRDLNLLHLLGNVCRHGDGTSYDRLLELHPELWTKLGISPPLGTETWPLPQPTASSLSISAELLERLVGAIESFWDEAKYIYNESIEGKGEHLEALLVEERKKRVLRKRR